MKRRNFLKALLGAPAVAALAVVVPQTDRAYAVPADLEGKTVSWVDPDEYWLPPAQPTDLAGTWGADGDLTLTWTNPPDANFKDIDLRIYAEPGGELLRTIRTCAEAYTYTRLARMTDTGGAWASRVYVEARSIAFSLAINTVNPPSLTTRWLIMADDLEFDHIRATHIQSGAITADRIYVNDLASITC